MHLGKDTYAVAYQNRRIPIFSYHGIVGGAEMCIPDGWSASHTVPLASFGHQLEFLKRAEWISVLPEAIDEADSSEVKKTFIVTFDDAHSSDVAAAAALRRYDYLAIMYVPWAHTNRRGYLSSEEIQELASGGFAIGSHGVKHSPLTQKSDKELRSELVESKERLEDLIGKAVLDLAVPFGRYDRHVIAAARATGYRRIMTSDFGVARIRQSPVFPRLPVTQRTTIRDFQHLVDAGAARVALLRLSKAARRWRSALSKVPSKIRRA
jgi:peptidoglycan/xylan/chitin deacetylase (PgdA/CDA1 family)